MSSVSRGLLALIISSAAMLVAAFLAASAGANSGEREYVLIAREESLPPGLQQRVEEAGGTVVDAIPEIGAAVVRSGDAGFAERASGIRGVRAVVPDIEIRWIEPEHRGVAARIGDPPASGAEDPYFDLQWGHAAVDAVRAWAAGGRGAGVRVAVLDSGIDRQHPDLAPNLNEELSASFVPGEDYYVRPGVYFNHGTHVAGTLAAAENGEGVIGVAPEAEIVAVKVLSEFTGSGTFSGVAQGIVYAANIDSDIINMSLGGVLPSRGGYCVEGDCVSAREISELVNLMKRATGYAYREGTTIIASAGNSSFDRDRDGSQTVLPADLPNVISISATGPNGWALDPDTDLDLPAFYTNYGRSAIDLAAPGGNVDSNLRESGRVCTVAGVTDECWRFDLVYSAISGGWGWAAGTSMAAPHASGVAAIVIARNGGQMHPSQVETALRRSADDLGEPGRDPYYGHGRVNAAR